MHEFQVAGSDMLVLAIAVLWVGERVTKQIPLLSRFSIPVAVTGGLLCSVLTATLAATQTLNVSFDLRMRDTLLLVFFATIGISAKFSRLRAGGLALEN